MEGSTPIMDVEGALSLIFVGSWEGMSCDMTGEGRAGAEKREGERRKVVVSSRKRKGAFDLKTSSLSKG
jgi:hypothetical protein